METPATAATSAHDIASPTTKTPLPASAPPALPKKAEASAAAHAATLPPARAAAEMQTAHLAAKPAARSGSTASATSPTARLSNAEIAGLLARGDDLLRVGDVASARLFYERAAEAGNGQAALRMAATSKRHFSSRSARRRWPAIRPRRVSGTSGRASSARLERRHRAPITIRSRSDALPSTLQQLRACVAAGLRIAHAL